jgi:hypothetical protein
MTKKLERVFRDRRLTPEELERDAEVRQKVQREFPPSNGSRKQQPTANDQPERLPTEDDLERVALTCGRRIMVSRRFHEEMTATYFEELL